jgi:hypothetical protein
MSLFILFPSISSIATLMALPPVAAACVAIACFPGQARAVLPELGNLTDRQFSLRDYMEGSMLLIIICRLLYLYESM